MRLHQFCTFFRVIRVEFLNNGGHREAEANALHPFIVVACLVKPNPTTPRLFDCLFIEHLIGIVFTVLCKNVLVFTKIESLDLHIDQYNNNRQEAHGDHIQMEVRHQQESKEEEQDRLALENGLQRQRDADGRKHAADNRQHTNNLITKEIKNVLQIFRAVVHNQEAWNHRKQEQQSLRQQHVYDPEMLRVALCSHLFADTDKAGIQRQLHNPNDCAKNADRHSQCHRRFNAEVVCNGKCRTDNASKADIARHCAAGANKSKIQDIHLGANQCTGNRIAENTASQKAGYQRAHNCPPVHTEHQGTVTPEVQQRQRNCYTNFHELLL